MSDTTVSTLIEEQTESKLENDLKTKEPNDVNDHDHVQDDHHDHVDGHDHVDDGGRRLQSRRSQRSCS